MNDFVDIILHSVISLRPASQRLCASPRYAFVPRGLLLSCNK